MSPKVALVTGSSGGIGRALVARFLDAGYRVVGVDRTAVSGPPVPGPMRFDRADLGEEADVRRVVGTLGRTEGRLDALVHNAAIQVCEPLQGTSTEDWDRLMAVNLRAAFLLARESLTLMRARGCSVVHVASVHALATSLDIAAYAASKGGLVALSRAMAVELGPHRIRVNAVLPGAVETSMLTEGLQRRLSSGDQDVSELKSRLAGRTVLGRLGAPDDIAEAVLFLSDPHRSGFITGQALVVDGGATARLSTE